MRTLVVTENITLDGVIDAAGGWFGPAGDGETDQSDMIDAIAGHRAAADAFLVGRRTFEDMRGYWPARTDDRTGVSGYLNEVAKYVVSSTLGDPAWANTAVLRGPAVEEVRRLKSLPGTDIVTTGSMRLVRTLIAAGLVDEYRLFVHPVVVGSGQRLFDDAGRAGSLRLLEARPFRSGVVLVRYRPA
jgi:dihydrofolate reductase